MRLRRNPIFGSARVLMATAALVPVLTLTACSSQRTGPTAPSAPSNSPFGAGGSTQSKPAPPSGNPDVTVVSFSNYTSSTQSVSVDTTTTSDLGQPYIDQGKVQLHVWVDLTGKPNVSTVAGQWVNLSGSGINPISAVTHTVLDLDNLASLSSTDAITVDATCGDTISFEAHYVTGGGRVHVSTHASAPSNITLVCGSCTVTQGHGYWKNHPSAWPVTSLTLGARSYTQSELISILTQPAAPGNGLITLSYQLIAAKLNRANGAPNTSNVDAAIAAADALIGSLVVPPVGSGLLSPTVTNETKDLLEAYNQSCTPSE